MRNMSFSKTTQQIKDRTKTVTRRWGWWDLKDGERMCAVEKAMGLKKGEKINRLCVIEILNTCPAPLCNITKAECVFEGFPDSEPFELAALLIDMRPKKCKYDHPNRIAFKYIEEGMETKE